MTTLVLGANTVLNDSHCDMRCDVRLESSHPFGQAIGCVWLAIDGQRQAVTSPAYLHETKDWATLKTDDTSSHVTWQLDLADLFTQKNAVSVQLIIYAYQDPTVIAPAVEINAIDIQVNADIHYRFHTTDRHIKASKVLEIYQRNGQYKCRALAENSEQGLASFGQNLQISLDARYPQTPDNLSQIAPAPNQRPRPQPGETWTGTAFTIDPYHLLTCHHVIDGATMIGLRQQGMPDVEAQVVFSDEGSDSALLKVATPLPSYLPLRESGYDLLGESITTLGFPLTGLSSQLQVTQGNIAGLRGIANDIRYLQFTAPIQPGSSGSPLLIPNGEVVGMVTSSFVHEHTQNMNYAVKYQLLSALIASAGLNLNDLPKPQHTTTLSTPQLAKQSKQALWLVGCQA